VGEKTFAIAIESTAASQDWQFLTCPTRSWMVPPLRLKIMPFSGNKMCWSHTCPPIFVLETEKYDISLALFVHQNLNRIFPKQMINV